jgi:hypothetical protein
MTGKLADGPLKDTLKPEHLPTIPDKVIDNLRKGKDVAIEELAGPDAPRILEEAKQRRSAPVHAEDLTPITKTQAAAMRNFNPSGTPGGGSMPNFPAQKRVIPAPFRRPHIDLTSRPEDRRTWQMVRADSVRIGDIVVDLGLVIHIVLKTHYEEIAGVRAATGFVVYMEGPERVAVYDPHEQVRAFRLPEGDAVDSEGGAASAPGSAPEQVS